MQRLLSIIMYLIVLIFLESAAEVTGTPTAAPAEIPVEPYYVALTFDDGPRRETTEALLNGLRMRGASATFFLVGERLSGNEDLVRRMEAEGHQVGNHTWDHVRLQGDAPGHQLLEIQRTDRALGAILNGSGYWLRPPYGLIDPGMEPQITVPMVQWSVDPRDWENRNTEKIVQAVLADVEPGDIILLHDIYQTSVDAALQIVDALTAQGYWFVTVEELLALNGIRPEPGVLYRSA